MALIREGNPGHQKIREGVKVPLEDLTEPSWAERFPDVRGEPAVTADNRKCRRQAHDLWTKTLRGLKHAVGLTEIDETILTDYVVVVCRINQAEREIGRRGLVLEGVNGYPVKNPALTMATQYRTQLRAFIGELGLSPSARGRMLVAKKDEDDPDDVFDSGRAATGS